ncbi:MAG: radical SAM protein [Desulfobacteraceae bacterium]|nr:radical SAM protein [Desulfobacteraceae bacterium]
MGSFSLILLPTLRCNADCDYCFERKSEHCLEIDQLGIITGKVMDHMESIQRDSLCIYWQGGEVLTLPPDWYRRAYDLIGDMAEARGKRVFHYLQSNLLGYDAKWNGIISEMFGNSAGSSMDFPNLHRRLKAGGTVEYNLIWTRKLREARDAGIKVGIIAIPNSKTLELGAERFYSYFADELGLSDFQVNTPFPGGAGGEVKPGFPLDEAGLGRFLSELAEIWTRRGLEAGVRLGPFHSLSEYFLNGTKELNCIWRDNCANEFVCVGPRGHVAQCDCWVTSYPDHRFGNILDEGSLTEMLRKSGARRDLKSRPGILIEREDCLECEYLSLCHGGCPVRAFTVYGDLMRKDPYCGAYRRLFQTMENLVDSGHLEFPARGAGGGTQTAAAVAPK